MLKATMENLVMRGSRAMLRRMEIRAWVSTGWRVAESESWGAKLTITLMLSGSAWGLRAASAGCSMKDSVSAGWTALAGISREICLSLAGSEARSGEHNV